MNAQVQPRRFKLAWFAAGIAVVPLSVALSIAVLLAAGALLSVFDYSWYRSVGGEFALGLAIFWLVNGCCIGILQKIIVKRYLRVDLGRWTVYSTLGAMLAGALAYPCLDGACLPSQFYDLLPVESVATVGLSLVILIYLTVLSAAQCLGLQRRAKGCLRWIAAHFGSQLLVMLSLTALNAAPGLAQYNMILTLVPSVVLATCASGIVMWRLLADSHSAAIDDHDEWAYQPAPIASASRSERSIWDEAI